MKKILLALFTAVLVLSGFNSASAAIVSAKLIDDDANLYNSPFNSVINHPSEGEYGVTFLKFVLPELNYDNILSTKLTTYANENVNDPETVRAYVIKNDNWDYNSYDWKTNPANYLSLGLGQRGQMVEQTSELSKIDWLFNFSELNEEQLAFLQNAGLDGVISFVLEPGEPVLGMVDEDIFSKEYDSFDAPYGDETTNDEQLIWDTYIEGTGSQYTPQLSFETSPTPVPEPSSMILGLMGLGSLFGFRRKKSA